MKNNVNNTLEFIYQETAIHFLINPLDKNVMVNATEMAKMFGKKTKYYLETQTTKKYIEALERAVITDHSDYKIVENRGHVGIYFDRRLALDFAGWLNVDFKVWIYSTIDEIIFGNYKQHWEAHAMQEKAKLEMETLKYKMLTKPTPEIVANYFKQAEIVKNAKAAKTKAIRNQLKLF